MRFISKLSLVTIFHLTITCNYAMSTELYEVEESNEICADYEGTELLLGISQMNKGNSIKFDNSGSYNSINHNSLGCLLGISSLHQTEDRIVWGGELFVDLGTSAKNKALKDNYTKYNEFLLANQAITSGNKLKEPYNISMNQGISPTILFKIGYVPTFTNMLFSLKAGLSLSKIKTKIWGQSNINNSLSTDIYNNTFNAITPVIGLSVEKRLTPSINLKINYSKQLNKSKAFNDNLHQVHNLKFKKSCISLVVGVRM